MEDIDPALLAALNSMSDDLGMERLEGVLASDVPPIYKPED